MTLFGKMTFISPCTKYKTHPLYTMLRKTLKITCSGE